MTFYDGPFGAAASMQTIINSIEKYAFGSK